MTESHQPDSFASQLLGQDKAVDESDYREYRMKLEVALTTAERREKIAGITAAVAFGIGLVLMFVGGSRVVGSFDPWSRDATVLSITLGVIYCIALVVWPVAMASYFSRFRPRAQAIKEQIRDTNILALQSEVAALRKEVVAMRERSES
jgi:hypothetical protein